MGQYRTLLRQRLATGLFLSLVVRSGMDCVPQGFHSRELLLWLVEVGCLCGLGWPGTPGLKLPSASVSRAAEVTDLGHGVWGEETGRVGMRFAPRTVNISS